MAELPTDTELQTSVDEAGVKCRKSFEHCEETHRAFFKTFEDYVEGRVRDQIREMALSQFPPPVADLPR